MKQLTAGTVKKAKVGATMSDLISREALLKRMNRRLDILRKEFGPFDHYTDGYDEAVDHVMDFPAAEAEPVRHGRWICPDYDFSDYWKCSACNEDFYFEYDPSEGLYHYCPNCGAKMDGGSNDGTEKD